LLEAAWTVSLPDFQIDGGDTNQDVGIILVIF
jgi:hypothetical protein